MRTARPLADTSIVGDYPALYCLGAPVPSSKYAGMRPAKKRALWALGVLSAAALVAVAFFATTLL